MVVRHDESSYARAVRLAHGAALAPQQWPDALAAIADYVGGTGVMLVVHDFWQHQHWLLGGRLDPDLSRLYLERHSDNLVARAALRRGPGLYMSHELVDSRTVLRSEMGADIWAPQRIESMCQLVHPGISTGGVTGGFGVTLTRRQVDDANVVHRRLRRIGPQIRLAADLYLARSERLRVFEARARMLDMLEEPALLVSSTHVVCGANRSAELLLAKRDAFTTARHDRLDCADQQDGARLRLAVSDAALRGFATSFRLLNPQGWLAIVAPAPELSGDGRLMGPGTALVRLIDPHGDAKKRAATTAALFGLSTGETAVLAEVARGRSAPEAGRALRRSPETVRTHLKHIFDKTGVRSQAELAQLVARLPGTSGTG